MSTSFLNKLRGADYKTAFNWAWDEKSHAMEMIVLIESSGHKAVFNAGGAFVECDSSVVPVRDPPVWMRRRGEKWAIVRMSGDESLLPTGCVVQKVVGSDMYHVCEIASVWRVKEDVVIRDVVGYFGVCLPTRTCGVFNVDLKVFKLLPGMYVNNKKLLGFDEQVASAPGYSNPVFGVKAKKRYDVSEGVNAYIMDDAIDDLEEEIKGVYMPSDPAYAGVETVEQMEEESGVAQLKEDLENTKQVVEHIRASISELKENVSKKNRSSIWATKDDVSQPSSVPEPLQRHRDEVKRIREILDQGGSFKVVPDKVSKKETQEKESKVIVLPWTKGPVKMFDPGVAPPLKVLVKPMIKEVSYAREDERGVEVDGSDDDNVGYDE